MTGQQPSKTMNTDANLAESPGSADLHKELRSLTMLLTLASVINNQGQALLREYKDAYQDPLDRSQPTRILVLNAVAALIVRDKEAVAVAACDPGPPQYVLSACGEPEQSHSYHLLVMLQGPRVNDPAMQNDADLAMVEQECREMKLQASKSTMPGFTSIRNPDVEHNDVESSNDSHFILATAGTSHWDLNYKKKWDSLDIG